MSTTGLDMYLHARRYIGGWGHSGDEERNEYERYLELFGMQGMPDAGSPHVYADVCIGYWRKANQVHAWFVKNCQDGVDECQETEVSREQLAVLRAECLSVLAMRGKRYAKQKAQETLPPQPGFFFGTYEVDDYYYQDLEHTVEVVDKALTLPDTWWFQYQSSW